MRRLLVTLAALLVVSVSAAPVQAAAPPLGRIPPPGGAVPGKSMPDAGTGVPHGVRPSSGPGTTDVMPLASSSSGYFTCTAPVGDPVENTPSGYVTGQCLNGWKLHANEQDVLGGDDWWAGGYVNGSYAGCGWIDFLNTSYQTGTAEPSCNPPSFDISTFILYALGYYWIWTDSSGTDGVLVTPTHACPIYANYRPWLTGQQPTTQINYTSTTHQIKLRYLAENPSASGVYYAMVHDPSVGTGYGNWGYVSWSCLT